MRVWKQVFIVIRMLIIDVLSAALPSIIERLNIT